MKLINGLVFPLILLSLGGCSNAPREVTASVKLVEPSNKLVGDEFSPKHGEALEHGIKGATISDSGLNIRLGARFTSALGLDCREITVEPSDSAHKNGNAPQRRVACAGQKQKDDQERVWYLISNIHQSSTNLNP